MFMSTFIQFEYSSNIKSLIHTLNLFDLQMCYLITQLEELSFYWDFPNQSELNQPL